MAGTRNRGPYVALGPLLDGTMAPTPYDGTSGFFGGTALLDPRYSPANKDSQNNALFPAWFSGGQYVLTNNIPSAAGTAVLAAAQNAVSATAFAFVTGSPGATHSGVPSFVNTLPMIPMGSTAPINVLALDFGFTTGTTTAGNITVGSVPDTSLFGVGQWICIGGAGNTANTTSFITQVAAILTPQTLTTTVPVPGALTNAPIGSANQYNISGFYPNPGQSVATAVLPYRGNGELLQLDPAQTIARGISISGGASTTGGTFTVTGYDIYGVLMHESIVASTAGTTIYGKKAFKYLVSVTPQFADAHPYTVGISDVYGIHLCSLYWEALSSSWAGTAVPSNAGWTAALAFTTGTATFTTADVRGTIQTSGDGGGTHSVGATVSDGNVIRLYIAASLPGHRQLQAPPNYTVPLLGLAQV